MFKIINIQQINKEHSRELGNKVITEIIQNAINGRNITIRVDICGEYC